MRFDGFGSACVLSDSESGVGVIEFGRWGGLCIVDNSGIAESTVVARTTEKVES